MNSQFFLISAGRSLPRTPMDEVDDMDLMDTA
jgi:hypothetical protein